MSYLPYRLVLAAGLVLLLWQAHGAVRGQDVKAPAPKDKAADPKDAKAPDAKDKAADPKDDKAPDPKDKAADPKDPDAKGDDAKAPDGKEAEIEKAAVQRVLRKAEDEYRLYFKRPQTVPEFWAAMNFEMDVGKFDIAALFLNQLVMMEKADEVDKDLLKIERVIGLSGFLRLQEVQKWNDNTRLQARAEEDVRTLINRISAALEKSLADPIRITRFIKTLSSQRPEERAFAFAELKRSRERATSYLVDALRQSAGSVEHERLKEYMLRLDSEILPPLFEVFMPRDAKDAADVDLRYTLLDIIRLRDETRAIPYLWHLAASPHHPELIRSKARQTLASLLRVDVDGLPEPRAVLTKLAWQYYRHEVRFSDTKRIRIWEWKGKELARQPFVVSASQAEQYFAMRFADQALELDPAYRPAQEIFLTLKMERAFGRNLDQLLLKNPPDAMNRLLATLDGDLLLEILERALTERNLPVALPLIRVLGERGDLRAARPNGQGVPRGLFRALYYPDRRVQMAGVKAVVRMPAARDPALTSRVIEVLGRFLAADSVPRALVAFVPEDRLVVLRKEIKAFGFEPIFTANAREFFEALHKSADIDVILIHPAAPPLELSRLLGQLPQDSYGGQLPIVLLAPADKKENRDVRDSLDRYVARLSNAWVMSEGLTSDANEMKERLEDYIKLAMAPTLVKRLPVRTRSWVEDEIIKAGGQKLSVQERKQFRGEAMDLLWRIARGDVANYDVRPVQANILEAIKVEDFALQAIEILGRLPGAEVQQRLAGLVLEPDQPKLRLPAVVEMNRHIRTHGLLLSKQQVEAVKRAATDDKEDPGVRAQLALVVGQLYPGSRLTGLRLRDYTPDAPPPRKE